MMRILNIRVSDLETRTLWLGYAGENEHTRIQINCAAIYSDNPNATVAMSVKPPQGDTYPGVVTVDGVFVVWDVTDSDVIYPGSGNFQLTFTDNGEVIKTAIGSTEISNSIEANGEIPTPIEHWIEQANELLSEFETDLAGKQDAPETAGTSGQVLGLNSNLEPVWVNQSGGGGGTSDYSDLTNKPQINSVTLSGNKSLSDLGIVNVEVIRLG